MCGVFFSSQCSRTFSLSYFFPVPDSSFDTQSKCGHSNISSSISSQKCLQVASWVFLCCFRSSPCPPRHIKPRKAVKKSKVKKTFISFPLSLPLIPDKVYTSECNLQLCLTFSLPLFLTRHVSLNLVLFFSSQCKREGKKMGQKEKSYSFDASYRRFFVKKFMPETFDPSKPLNTFYKMKAK